MEIVLFEPKIPQNTGNIVRTCAVVGASLILVGSLGFSLAKRHLRRSGLDYFSSVTIEHIEDLAPLLHGPFYFFSSKATTLYTEVEYPKESRLIFGSETSGLPDDLFEKYPDHFVTLPMQQNQRCLNLSNAVAVGAYEAWRQHGFG